GWRHRSQIAGAFRSCDFSARVDAWITRAREHHQQQSSHNRKVLFSAVFLHRVEAQCDFLLHWVSKEFFPVIPPSSCVVSFAINLGFANVLYTGSSMASSVPRPSRSPLSSP